MSSNSAKETLGYEELLDETLVNVNGEEEEQQEWDNMPPDWLSPIPEPKPAPSLDMEEAWLQPNQSSSPNQLLSDPDPNPDPNPNPNTDPNPSVDEGFSPIRSNSFVPFPYQYTEGNQFDQSQARFQRTDQWLPVYTWLESLDTDEVIKSQDVIDWLTANNEVKEDLYSRHSRYHLMHYIKKCHLKILKRKEKKKGLPTMDTTNSIKIQKTGGTKLQVPLSCSNVNSVATDSEMYVTKRNEAFRKYEILVEMEQQLATLFSKREDIQYLTQS